MNSKKRGFRLLVLIICLLVMIGILVTVNKFSAKYEEESAEDTVSYHLIGMTASEVDEIGVISSAESYNLQKEGEAWMCLEDSLLKLDSTLIDSFLEEAVALTSEVKIEDVTDFEQYGLEEEFLSVTLQSENNMYVIKVGNYNSVISAYYVQINDDPVVYTITSSQYYQLNQNLEDFELVEETEISEEQINESEVTTTE